MFLRVARTWTDVCHALNMSRYESVWPLSLKLRKDKDETLKGIRSLALASHQGQLPTSMLRRRRVISWYRETRVMDDRKQCTEVSLQP